MPAYTHYQRFLTETGLEDSLHVFCVWVEQYGELMLFDDSVEE